MGVFVSLDLILFFVFWELMLIPSYFLIKLWGGGAERHYAALKYVLYTLLGSVFMLVGIALLDINYHQWATLRHMEPTYSFDLLELLSVPIPLNQQILIFWLLFLGFAFKAPVFPFHTWLPDALLEGPIGMAVVLAGLKLGTFGFIRFSIPLLPEASKSQTVVSIIMALGLAAILYGAIMALIQQDFRRLLAFSSISHLGFVVIGLFALNYQGLQGSLLTMINLGFSTAGLFFIAGFLYSRQQTHPTVGSFGGMAKQTPLLATFFLFIGLASIGLPGTNGFVGEFLILLGTFKANWLYGSDRGHRRHLRRGLFSLVLRTVDAGTARQGRQGLHQRSASPRNDSSRGLVGDDPLDRPLSRSLLENDERIGAGVGRSTGIGEPWR